MVVGTPRYDSEPMVPQSGRQRSRILNDLPLVNLKFWTKRLSKAHRLGGDHMHEWPSLHARKYHRINLLGILFSAQDQSAARTPQGFVGGRSDEVSMRDWCRVNSRGNQSRDMSHIYEEIGPNLFRYSTHPLVVHDPGIGTRSTGY